MLRSSLRSASALRLFLEEGPIQYAVSPIVPIAANESTDQWVDWLVRPTLADPTITTGHFVRALKSLKLGRELDQRVAANALQWLGQQPDETRLTLHIAAASEPGAAIGPFLLSLLETHRIAPQRLCIALTNSETLSDLDTAIKFIRQMRNEGCRISMESAELGDPVLGLCGPLRLFDYLTIGNPWIAPGEQNEPGQRVLEELVEGGRQWALEIHAKGVDNQDLLTRVKALGFDYYQGLVNGQAKMLEEDELEAVVPNDLTA